MAIVLDNTFCGKKINRIDRNHLWWINIVNCLHLHDEFMRKFVVYFFASPFIIETEEEKEQNRPVLHDESTWMDSELNMHFNEMDTKFMQFSVSDKLFFSRLTSTVPHKIVGDLKYWKCGSFLNFDKIIKTETNIINTRNYFISFARKSTIRPNENGANTSSFKHHSLDS